MRNYPEYRTIQGEGRKPLPALLRWLLDPDAMPILIIGCIGAALVAAFLVGLTMGQSLATTAIGMEQVLR